MSRFENAVIEVLGLLEPGEVVTYGEVAFEAGFPGAARAVGTLLRTTTADVPWWRVVGADGHLRSANPPVQAALLGGEGVLVLDDRVDLVRNQRPRRERPN